MAHEHVPDLIVSDVMMPVMNGLEFCQQIKADVITSHIPVILLTARALEKHQIEGYESGADAYITKPFLPELLLARIDNLLRNRQQLRGLWSVSDLQAEPQDKSSSTPQPQESPVALTPREQAFIDSFMQTVEDRMCDSELSVEELASDMGMSRVQLYRKVKVLTGNSPIDLLRKARLARALHLLHSSDLTISEIAYRVGFSTPSYFTKCFRDEYGQAPGDSRKTGKS